MIESNFISLIPLLEGIGIVLANKKELMLLSMASIISILILFIL